MQQCFSISNCRRCMLVLKLLTSSFSEDSLHILVILLNRYFKKSLKFIIKLCVMCNGGNLKKSLLILHACITMRVVQLSRNLSKQEQRTAKTSKTCCKSNMQIRGCSLFVYPEQTSTVGIRLACPRWHSFSLL